MQITIETLTILQFIILTIGAYSITRLIVTDDFPLFKNARTWIKDRFPPDDYAMEKRPPARIDPKNWRRVSNGLYVVTKGHWLGEMISCPWCAGWWVSLVVWIAFVLFPFWTIAILVPFAMRAFVGGYAAKIGGG